MLNPIVNVWSAIEAFIKRELADNMREMVNEEILLGTTKKDCRLDTFEGIIEDSLKEVTLMLCNRVITKIQRIVPSILNLNDVEY